MKSDFKSDAALVSNVMKNESVLLQSLMEHCTRIKGLWLYFFLWNAKIINYVLAPQNNGLNYHICVENILYSYKIYFYIFIFYFILFKIKYKNIFYKSIKIWVNIQTIRISHLNKESINYLSKL